MLFKRRGLKSSRKAKEAQKTHVIRAALIASIFTSLIVIISLASHLPEMTIKGVDIRGSALLSEEELEKQGNKYLASKYFGIFSKANIFFYPTRKAKSDFLDIYPEIKNITIKKILISVDKMLYTVCDSSCSGI